MKTGFRVCDVMSKKPIIVNFDTLVSDACKIMLNKNVGSLLIKKNEMPIGMIREHDIVTKLVAKSLNPIQTSVESIMNSSMPSIGPNEDLYDALIIMRKKGVRQLLVQDNNRLVGLLTLNSILDIEPEIIDIAIEREESADAIIRTTALKGVCDSCSEYSRQLTDSDGEFICKNCIERQITS